MKKRALYVLAGLLAGAVNGFFGTGGGMVLVPIFLRGAGMDEKKALANSVAVIAPLCALSLIIYITKQSFDLSEAWPYLAGGILGGGASGILFKKVNSEILRRVFGAALICGGIRALVS